MDFGVPLPEFELDLLPLCDFGQVTPPFCASYSQLKNKKNHGTRL